jgi:hypothetical protein
MQGEYKVTKAQQARTYQGKYGEMVVWKVRLEDATTEATDGVFELHKKPGNEPKPGDTLDVERSQQGEFDGAPFVRLFLAKPQNAGGGQSYGGGGGRRDDATTESIQRQTASKVAGVLAAAAGPGQVGMPQVLANFEAAFDTVLTKIQGAQNGASGNGAGGQGEIPADTTGLTPAPAGVSDQVPF